MKKFSFRTVFLVPCRYQGLVLSFNFGTSDVCSRHPVSEGQFLSQSAGWFHEAAIHDCRKHGCCWQKCRKWWIWQFNCTCRQYHGYVRHNQTVQNMPVAHIWVLCKVILWILSIIKGGCVSMFRQKERYSKLYPLLLLEDINRGSFLNIPIFLCIDKA